MDWIFLREYQSLATHWRQCPISLEVYILMEDWLILTSDHIELRRLGRISFFFQITATLNFACLHLLTFSHSEVLGNPPSSDKTGQNYWLTLVFVQHDAYSHFQYKTYAPCRLDLVVAASLLLKCYIILPFHNGHFC
jgi:hypothetical protein